METPADMAGGDRTREDRALVQRARRGDAAAFHDLADRHAAALFGLAVALVGNAADAEDIVQETFLGALRGLRGFRGQSSVKTWLMRILFRQAAGHLRGRHRWLGFLRAAPSTIRPTAPSAAQAADTRMDVSAAILALAPEHREVIVLRELQGLSYGQIAEVLAIPPGTVESRLFRARRAMQELLSGYLE